MGDRLRKARSLTGLTTRDFAEQIGVSHGTISNAEGDKRAVRPITLKAWSLATGVDAQWLETGTAPRDGFPEGGELRARHDSNVQPSDPKVLPLVSRRAA